MSEIIQNPSSLIRVTKQHQQQQLVKKPATKRSSSTSSTTTTTTTTKSKSTKNTTTSSTTTTTTTTRSKQQPLKVVYISNPMRVETSAAEFRALVQELTGQDAAEWSDPSPKRIQVTTAGSGERRGSSTDDDIHNRVVDPDPWAGAGYGQPMMSSCFGSSDLDYFGPFDGGCDHHDQMVLMEAEFSSYYGCLQQQ